ncbi:MAG: ABC transporter substrate-binding protein [Anaerolineae bacterium]|nr:ABC transporter substrate-binding protein [Anaerolineae bacterium]
MKRQLSSLFVFLVIVSLVLSMVGCQGKSTPSSKAGQQGTTYKIGFIAAITGKASFLGEPERDVAVMLQKQLDEQGGITGPDGVVHPVKILIHDTEGSGDVAIPVVKKLINDEQVVAIIGPTRSPVTMALIPVIQEAEVPMISMASSSAIVEPVAERKWIFKVAQSNKHTAPWQVRYAKAKGWTKVANIYVNNAYGEDGAKAIRAAAKEAGVQIVLEETFDATDTDMTAQITKIKASDAQAVLVTAIPPAAAIFTKQYRELGVSLPLIHNSGVAMKPFIDLAGAENVEGVVFPMGKLVAADALPDDDPQKAVLQKFIKDYTSHTGKPPSTFAGHAWDSIQIILQVLQTLPEGLSIEEQRAQLRDGIENLKGFVGVDGVFNFSPEDHVGLSSDDVVLVRITNGDWKYFPPEEW